MLMTKRKVKNQIEQEINIIEDLMRMYPEVPPSDPSWEYMNKGRSDLRSRESALRMLAMHLEIELAV